MGCKRLLLLWYIIIQVVDSIHGVQSSQDCPEKPVFFIILGPMCDTTRSPRVVNGAQRPHMAYILETSSSTCHTHDRLPPSSFSYFLSFIFV